ncbi:MAG: hypothetical protein V7735_23470 [Photobacterium frigidiphilum]|uniref:hypothetical protein n=1 Tax=Photobacterium frigidiphilum TaxID=264736 RepID=UPI0030037B1D
MKLLYKQIREELFLALNESNVFTTSGLRDSYISNSNQQIRKNSAMAYVEMIIERLLEFEIVEKAAQEDNGRIVFSKTKDFSDVIWGIQGEDGNITHLRPSTTASDIGQRAANQDKLKQLLNDCDSKFITPQYELEIYEKLGIQSTIISNIPQTFRINHHKKKLMLLGKKNVLKSALKYARSDNNQSSTIK